MSLVAFFTLSSAERHCVNLVTLEPVITKKVQVSRSDSYRVLK